jgi:transposase InsO family protein
VGRNTLPSVPQGVADRKADRLDGTPGNPYDNAKAESVKKTLKVEAVYPMAFESFKDIAEHLPHFTERSTTNAGFIRRSAI